MSWSTSTGGELPQMLTLEEQRRHARELLSDPFLQQAFLEITEAAITTWRNSDNPLQREQQWHTIRAIFELQRVLEAVLGSEKLMERRERRLRGHAAE